MTPYTYTKLVRTFRFCLQSDKTAHFKSRRVRFSTHISSVLDLTVCRRLITVEARSLSEVSRSGICGVQSGTWTGFPPPCQYHSINIVLSFIHLALTPFSVYNCYIWIRWNLQFQFNEAIKISNRSFIGNVNTFCDPCPPYTCVFASSLFQMATQNKICPIFL